MTYINDLIIRIEQLLKKNNFTIAELARKTGLSRLGLDNLLSGKGNPTLETLEKIASALDIPMSFFFEDNVADKHEYNIKHLLYYIDFIEKFYGIDGVKLRDEFTKRVALPQDDPDFNIKYEQNLIRLSNLILKFHETARVLQEMRGKFPEANFDNYIKE